MCEGINTEPEYFKAFPVVTADVKSYGLSMSKTALVQVVIDIAKALNNKNQETWVVFDMDINPDNADQQKEDFNNAIALAEKIKSKLLTLMMLLNYGFYSIINF